MDNVVKIDGYTVVLINGYECYDVEEILQGYEVNTHNELIEKLELKGFTINELGYCVKLEEDRYNG